MELLRKWAIKKYGDKRVVEEISKILEMTEVENLMTMRIQLSTQKTLERLELLIAEDRNIEYITIGSSLVEFGLIKLIQSHEFVVNSSLVLADFDTSLSVKAKIQNSNNALGGLRTELGRFCKNESLFGMLGTFNGMRTRVTHKIYEKSLDISKVNEEVRGYVRGRPITKIIQIISNENTNLVNNLTDKFQEYGCELAGPADLEAIKKKVIEQEEKRKK